MKPQFGVCKNKVGCSLAYTGEKVPLPPDLKCPECGQTLVVEKSGSGGNKVLLILLLMLLLLVCGAGAAFLLFKDKLAGLAPHKTTIVQQSLAPTPEENASTQTPERTPPPPDRAADSSTANSQASTNQRADETPPPQTSPPLEETVQNKPQSSPEQTRPPSPPSQPEKKTQARNESEPPAGPGGEIQPPAALSKNDIDATREDVLKRINAMPKFSAEEKKRLSEKMEMARSMDRLLVIRFDTGQTALAKNAADDLAKRIKSKEVQNKISDPTVVFVVAGYADAAGDPKKNLQISQLRADNVTKALKDRTNLLNVIHSVGMGSTDLLDSKRTDQNRAVEVWAVAP
jgi:outer membrane protein OmpA-like peptidoglycan-associated protein